MRANACVYVLESASACVGVCVQCLVDPCISRQILFASCRGIKATRDRGYVVFSDFLSSRDWLMNVTWCYCMSPSARLWVKRFEMHEIPGMLFFPSGQTQQAFQCSLFLNEEWLGQRAKHGVVSHF